MSLPFDRETFERVITDIQTGLQDANDKRNETLFTTTTGMSEPIQKSFKIGTQIYKIPKYLLQSSSILKIDTVVLQFKDISITVSADTLHTDSLSIIHRPMLDLQEEEGVKSGSS